MDNVYHIVYILNDAYFLPVAVSARSALFHCCVGFIHFHLIVDNVSSQHLDFLRKELASSRSEVHFISPDLTVFRDFPDWHGSRLVWTRCVLPELLPDVHGWVCVCDGDTLWMKGPELVWQHVRNMPTDIVLAGSHHNQRDPPERKRWFLEQGLTLYTQGEVCMGFALLHLNRMRAAHVSQQSMDFITKFGVPPYLEQDILNWLFRDKRAVLPKGWGVFSHGGIINEVHPDDIAVIHYVNDLPCHRSWKMLEYDVIRAWWMFKDDVLGWRHLKSNFQSFSRIGLRLLGVARFLCPSLARRRFQWDPYQLRVEELLSKWVARRDCQ